MVSYVNARFSVTRLERALLMKWMSWSESPTRKSRNLSSRTRCPDKRLVALPKKLAHCLLFWSANATRHALQFIHYTLPNPRGRIYGSSRWFTHCCGSPPSYTHSFRPYYWPQREVFWLSDYLLAGCEGDATETRNVYGATLQGVWALHRASTHLFTSQDY